MRTRTHSFVAVSTALPGLEVRIARVYVTVQDMDRAVGFYENLLGAEVNYREGRDLAEFNAGSFCLELLNRDKIGEDTKIGNNCVVVLDVPRKEDVDRAYDFIKALGNHDTEIFEIPIKKASLRGFQFHDTEGNLLELYYYDWKR